MLIEEVRDRVRQYLDENPKRSITSLARKSGLSYSTVRRLVNNETSQCGIDTTIIPILSVFLSREEIYELIGKYDEKFASVWKPLNDGGYQYMKPSQKVESWREFDQHIIGLAQHPEGVTKERIIRDLGEMAGLKRAEELCTIGLLRIVNDKFFTFTEHYTDPSATSMLEKISLLAKGFNQENLGQGAHFWIFSEPQVTELSKKCAKQEKTIFTKSTRLRLDTEIKKLRKSGSLVSSATLSRLRRRTNENSLGLLFALYAGVAFSGEQGGGGFISVVDHAELMKYIYTIQIPEEDYKVLEERLNLEEEVLVPRTELMARKIDSDIVVFSQELGELKVVPRESNGVV